MKIAILGCGYIGYPLAQELFKKKHIITCTTTNPKSIDNLNKVTQKSLILRGCDKDELLLLLKYNDVLVVTVEANNHDEYEDTFLETAHTIKECAKEIRIPKRLIFTSRSFIYGNHDGMWVDESSSLNAKDFYSKILIDTEKILSSLTDLSWKVTILRLAQIYGPNKEIVDLFKNIYKEVMPGNGNYYTNMVHLNDVVKAIEYVLNHAIEGIYNISDDEHPTREAFALRICKKLNLKAPKYDPTIADFADNNKRIANYRIKEKGFYFQHSKRKI